MCVTKLKENMIFLQSKDMNIFEFYQLPHLEVPWVGASFPLPQQHSNRNFTYCLPTFLDV